MATPHALAIARDEADVANLRRGLVLYNGAYRDRTDDLLVANQALSQLS